MPMSKGIIQPTNRSDDEKKRFLNEYFYYEVCMLLSAVNILCEFQSLGKEQAYKNLAMEHALVHGRLLREFFYSESRKKDDAHPVDFVSDFNKWKTERPPETCLIKKMSQRANKELMYLTYTRKYGTSQEKEWDFEPIRADLCKVVKIFLENVDTKYWDDPLSEIQQHLS
ncbi:hypothetical protein IBX65_08035 [Candidatus Aerophobetes bacterium]|nr:hypothetical protein [Candidatus Aerophobetes bacterium]